MRIFVAGATGVIGRRVIPQLVAAGHRVSAVARSPEKRAALSAAGAAPVTVDLFSSPAVRRAVEGHDVVINLATHIPTAAWRLLLPGAFHENDRIRRVVAANLADGARATGTARVIQESFAPVYPSSGDAWIDETVPIAPVSYNRTVADAERAADRFGQGGGAAVVLRFAAFYGPDSAQTRDLIRAARRGWALLPGAATSWFSLISHDDAAAAVVAALGAPAGIYNAADNEPVRRRDLFDALAAALGVAPPRLLPAWSVRLFGALGETMARSLRISNRKLRHATGWAPIYPSVREGFRATVAELSTSRTGTANP